MMPKQSPSGFSAIRGIIYLSVIGFCLIAVGLVNPPEDTSRPILSWFIKHTLELLPKLGEAFVIAAVLAVVVDQGLKLKLVEEVVSAAAPELIGRHLPDPVRKALLGYFTINFVRPSWEIDYEISAIEEHRTFAKVQTRVKGVIVNYGANVLKLPFITSLDPSLIDEKFGKSQITRVSMAEEYGEKIFDLVPPSDELVYTREVDAKPQVRYITVVESTEFLPISYFQPLFTATTVVSTTVRVRYDKALLNVKLEVPSDANPPPKAEDNQWGCEWDLHTPLLPGQCILLYWHTKSV
jgi:hypothetical protein